MYKIIVFNQTDNKPNVLDLYDDINISLNYTINDIRNLGAYNSNYSKTIIIPASKSNNTIFDGVYNINKKVFRFDKNKTLKCVILFDDVQIASGSLLLQQINYIKNDAYQYECYFLGDVYSIFDTIGTQSVYNLDWNINNLPEFTINNTNYNTTASYGTSSYKGNFSSKTRNYFNIGTISYTSLLNETYRIPDASIYNKNKSSDELIYLPNNYNNNFIDLNYTTSNLFTQSNFYNNNLYPSPLFIGVNNFENDANKYSTLKYKESGNLIRRYITLENYNFPVFDMRLLYIKILKENGYSLTSDSYNYLFNKSNNIYNQSHTVNGYNIFQDLLLMKTDYSDLDSIIEYIKPVVDYIQIAAHTVSNINYLNGIYSTSGGNSYFSYSIASSFTYSLIYPVLCFNNNLQDNNLTSDLLSASISYNNTTGVSFSNIATYSFQSNKYIFNDGNKNTLNGNPFSQDVNTYSNFHFNEYDNKSIMSDVNDADFDKYTFFVTHHNLLGSSNINTNPIANVLNRPYEYITYDLDSIIRPHSNSTYYGSMIDNKSQILRNFRNDNIIYFNSLNRVGLEFQNHNTPPKILNSNYEADINTNHTIQPNEFNYHYNTTANNEVFNTINIDFNFGKYIVEQPNYYQFEAGLFNRLEFYSPVNGFGLTFSTDYYVDEGETVLTFNAGTQSIGIPYNPKYPNSYGSYQTFQIPYYGIIGNRTTYNIEGTYSYEIGIFVEKNKDNYDIDFNSINDNEMRFIQQVGTLSYSFTINDFYTVLNNPSNNIINIGGSNYNTYKDDSTSATVSLHSISNDMKAYVGTTSTILSTTGSGGTISVNLPYRFDSFSKYTTDPKWSSTVTDKIWLDKGDKVFLQFLTKPFDDGVSLDINPQGFDYGIKKDGVRLSSGRSYANSINNEIESGYYSPNNSFVDNLYPVIDYYVGYTASANYDYESNLVLGTNSNITNRTIDYFGKKQFGFTDGNFFTGYTIANPAHLNVSSDSRIKIEANIYISSPFSFIDFEEKLDFNTYSNTSIYNIPDEIMEKGIYLLDFNETTPLSKNKPKVIDYFTIGNNSNNATVSINKFYDFEKGYNRYALYLYNGLTQSSLTASNSNIILGTNSTFKYYSVIDTDFIRSNDKIFINEDIKQSDIIKDFNRIYNVIIIPDNTNSKLLKIYPFEHITKNIKDWSDKLDLDSDYTISTNSILTKGYSIEYLKGEDKYSKEIFNGLSPIYDRLQNVYKFGEVANSYNINMINYTNKTKDNNDVIIDDFKSIKNVYQMKGLLNNGLDISINYLSTNKTLYANTQAIINNSTSKYYFNSDEWGLEVTGNRSLNYNDGINYRTFTPTFDETKKYYYQEDENAELIVENGIYTIDVKSENFKNYNQFTKGYVLTCYIKLDLLSINKLQLQDYIILNLDGNKSKWTINKIIDYTPTNSLTKVELIKNNN